MVSIKKNFIFFTILSVFGTLNSFSQNDVQKNNELITRVSKIDSASTKKKIIPIAIPITEPAVGYGLVAKLDHGRIIRTGFCQNPILWYFS